MLTSKQLREKALGTRLGVPTALMQFSYENAGPPYISKMIGECCVSPTDVVWTENIWWKDLGASQCLVPSRRYLSSCGQSNQLTAKAWEKTVQELGNCTKNCLCKRFRYRWLEFTVSVVSPLLARFSPHLETNYEKNRAPPNRARHGS